MIILSFVGLGGMIVVMATIIWQMHGHVLKERERVIEAQVVSALGIAQQVYGEYQEGRLSEADAKQMLMSHIAAMKYLTNGYFWIIDDSGVMLVHPYDPGLVGRPVLDLHDAHGRLFVKDMIAAARSGGGFVHYDWPRPTGGEPAAKIGYVMPFKPWKWVIGSGLYVDDLRAATVRQISLSVVLIAILFGVNVAISLTLSRRYMHEFRDRAIRDGLTGLYTRRYLDEIGQRMLRRSKKAGAPHLAAIFFDLDHFKNVNDSHGHKVGDRVLRTVSQILQSDLRPNEMAFRYGGEEIVVLLHASEAVSFGIAERIRAAVGKHEFEVAGKRFHVTLSAGVAVNQRSQSLSDLVRCADECMYAAKVRGRNCTVAETERETSAAASGFEQA